MQGLHRRTRWGLGFQPLDGAGQRALFQHGAEESGSSGVHIQFVGICGMNSRGDGGDQSVDDDVAHSVPGHLAHSGGGDSAPLVHRAVEVLRRAGCSFCADEPANVLCLRITGDAQ